MFAYVANNPINFTDPEGLEVFLVGRTPGFVRPGPWRPAPNQQYVPKVSPRPTPNPRLRPFFENPPKIVKPQPKPWWYWFLGLLRIAEKAEDPLGSAHDVFTTTTSPDPCEKEGAYGPFDVGDPNKPYEPISNPIGYL